VGADRIAPKDFVLPFKSRLESEHFAVGDFNHRGFGACR
jgi:hypothetical protein